jgi:hypothetical protein
MVTRYLLIRLVINQVTFVFLYLQTARLTHAVLLAVIPNLVLAANVTTLGLVAFELRLFELREKSLIVEHYQKIKI